MEVNGVRNTGECRSDAVREALKKAGYRLRTERVRWPRKVGSGVVLVDCSRGPVKNALFLR